METANVIRGVDKSEPTVAELVVENLNRARVFERFGLDYCCGGKVSLSEACSTRGVAVKEVVDALAVEDACATAVERDYANMGFAELAREIEDRHHAYLHEELPRLGELFEHVVNHHAKDHPELREAQTVFEKLRGELEQHMQTEEDVLFPFCEQFEQGKLKSTAEFHVLLAQLIYEHSEAGYETAQIRRLLSDFIPPEGACRKYLALLHRLEQFERDLHLHVHKENNLLIPRLRAQLDQ